MDPGPISWRIIQSGPCDPFFTMGLDEAILCTPNAPPTLRFYQWQPACLSLGVTQAAADLDLKSIHAQGFAVTRRATGGGAIAHKHELTYSIVCDLNDPLVHPDLRQSYIQFHEPILQALRSLGIDAQHREQGNDEGHPYCFARKATFDIMHGDKKIGGSAQRRKGGRLLQHGSLPMRASGMPDQAGAISELTNPAIDTKQLAERIAETFVTCFAIQLIPGEPSAAELELANKLAKHYASEDWIYRK